MRWALPVLVGLLAACSTMPYHGEAEIPAAHDAQSGLAPDRHTNALALVERAVRTHDAPGIQVAVAGAEGPIWTAAVGHADEGRSQPLRVDDTFQIGSATKLFTAVMVLRLVDRGELSLDDTIGRWLPDMRDAERITIRMLLSHHAGQREVLRTTSVLVGATLSRRRVWDQARLVRRMGRRRLDGEPGARFEYSNTHYLVLGEILRLQTGRPAHVLFEEELFGPLGMTRTWLPPAPRPTDRPSIEGIDRGMLPFGPHWMDPSQTNWTTLAYAAGGAHSSARDLVRFYRALFGGQLVSTASLKQMRTFLADGPMPEGSMNGYGLGLASYQLGDTEAWGHRGGIMGYDATPLHVPGPQLFVVVLTNHSELDSTLGLDLAGALTELVRRD